MIVSFLYFHSTTNNVFLSTESVPSFLQHVHTQRDLDETMEAMCAFLFKQQRTQEELSEVKSELGWLYDFAMSYLNRVPNEVPQFKEDTEYITYAYDGTPMEKVD